MPVSPAHAVLTSSEMAAWWTEQRKASAVLRVDRWPHKHNTTALGRGGSEVGMAPEPNVAQPKRKASQVDVPGRSQMI